TTQVVLIAAKPSIARWKLKGKYKRLNRKMAKLADDNPSVEYADVWNPMLEGGKVKQDIFIEDGLHMNAKGYQIWYDVLEPFVN
ncbi:GDSL-type esterase/lipase family protein, partial [Pricia sp.]|uniref:GDSL-type esterase/lipase family protein n=1 Tax=Pricia sp. TaxID=2268138 RepID=UPI0035948F74